MRSYIGERLIGAGFATALTALCMSWMAYHGAAQANNTTDGDTLTARQCIDSNTDGSVEPLEKALIKEGIIKVGLNEMTLTSEMCEEIIERTPGGTPVERAVAAANLTQELDIIEESMVDAAGKDVNGDGGVDPKDTKAASSSSYAAAHAAQQTVRTAAEKDDKDAAAIKEVNVEPVAALQQYSSPPASPPPAPPPQPAPPRQYWKNFHPMRRCRATPRLPLGVKAPAPRPQPPVAIVPQTWRCSMAPCKS
jgi:hypothetical protein